MAEPQDATNEQGGRTAPGAEPGRAAERTGRPTASGQRTSASAGLPQRGDRRAVAGQGRPAGGGQGRAPAGAARRPAGSGRGPASREEIEQRTYDPRREERRRASRIALPDDVDPRMLDPQARTELRSLARETADLVARHLVVTGQLLDDDPEQALVHARAARAMAGRVGIVREAAGLAAYAAGEWAEALSELRAARRITGDPGHLAVVADCERALGRPERALALGDDPDVARLEQDQRVELVIVLSGARRDLGQPDAAVLTLQDPARRTTDKRPWAARLWYAYADALLEAGRVEQAREWFGKAAEVDVEGATDAGDRVLLLDGFVLEDLDEDDERDAADLPTAAELAEYVASVGGAQPAETQSPPRAEPSAAESAPAESAPAESAPAESAPGQAAAGDTGPPPAAPAPMAPAAGPSGVLAPTFSEPPSRPDDEDDEGELRLFD